MADVPTVAVAVAVADVVVAMAATADEAPATDEDAVPTADIAMDWTTAVLNETRRDR